MCWRGGGACGACGAKPEKLAPIFVEHWEPPLQPILWWTHFAQYQTGICFKTNCHLHFQKIWKYMTRAWESQIISYRILSMFPNGTFLWPMLWGDKTRDTREGYYGDYDDGDNKNDDDMDKVRQVVVWGLSECTSQERQEGESSKHLLHLFLAIDYKTISIVIIICWWTLFYSHISLFQHRTWFYWENWFCTTPMSQIVVLFI